MTVDCIRSCHGLDDERGGDVAETTQHTDQDSPDDEPCLAEGYGQGQCSHTDNQVENVDQSHLVVGGREMG